MAKRLNQSAGRYWERRNVRKYGVREVRAGTGGCSVWEMMMKREKTTKRKCGIMGRIICLGRSIVCRMHQTLWQRLNVAV
jgi:hypothetical protein